MAGEGFRFLDLPPEIRNEIYALLLPVDKCIHIHTHRDTVHHNFYNRELPALLQTSKQIHEEVAPVLYGMVTFQFYVTAPNCRWLRSLGSMNRHIRHIDLLGWSKTSVRSGLHQLKQAKFLNKITIDGRLRYCLDGPTAAETAEYLRPFVKAIRKHNVQKAKGKDIIDSISMRTPSAGYIWQPATAEQQEHAVGEYTKTLRAELKRLLG